MTRIVAVHLGAGYQTTRRRDEYKRVALLALAAALKRLNDGGSALDAVHAAIIELENGELTNAGKGSNLDLNGNVSCDASLMDSESGGWAGVGCLYNIQNPITAAHLLLSNQLNPSTKAKELGLVQPMLLVGSDATEWALAHGCSRQDDLTTNRTKAIHRRQFQAWAEGGTSAATQKTLENSEIYDVGAFEEVITLDTVGAVVIDSSNRLAAGVSSGGVALKCPGRVGQAAMFGTGCWADETVAISTSGVGEQLIRSMLAQRCAQRLNVDESESKSDPLWSIRSLHESISTNFLENHHVTSNKAMAPSAGILTIVRERSTGSAHVLWAHTTPSFCIAYAVDDKSPSFSFSKLPTGQSIVVQSANS